MRQGPATESKPSKLHSLSHATASSTHLCGLSKDEESKSETNSRRTCMLTMLGLATYLPSWSASAEAGTSATVYVAAGESIGDAVRAAPAGALVLISPGEYRERLILDKAVVLKASEPGTVSLEHVTSKPYESTVEVVVGGVQIEGVRIRHSSKSIANNYGVYLKEAGAKLVGCDISSSTGCAVGIEGGNTAFQNCTFSGAKNHGLAIYGDLFGSACSATVEDCTVTDNKGDGILVRDGANATVSNCTLRGNGGYGLHLVDGSARLASSSVAGNRSGSVAAELGANLELVGDKNVLDKPASRL